MLLRLVQAALVLAAALPVAYLVRRHGVNVPFSDQWDFVATLNRWHQGSFALGELFELHNEHRMFFPKLIMLPTAIVTGWDTRAEMAVSIGMAGATLCVALLMLRPIMSGAGLMLRLWLPFFAAITIFSLRQWENWLWGWQIQWFLSLLGVLGTCALLGRTLAAANPWPWLAGAAATAVVVHFSIASGVVLWLAGAVVLACQPRPERWKLVVAWIIAGAVSSAVFFHGYVGNPGHPSPWKAFHTPLDLAKYVGGYLAGPIHVGQPWLAGIVLAALFLVASAMTISKAGIARAFLLPWVGVGLFGLGNAALTGIGRVGFGVAQGLASRYVTLALTVLLATVALGVFWGRQVKQGRIRVAVEVALATASSSRVVWSSWKTLHQVRAALSLALATALSLAVVWGSWKSLPHAVAFAARVEAGRDCLHYHRDASDACLTRLFPSAAALRQRIPPLEALGWSGFAMPRERLAQASTMVVNGQVGSESWKVLPATPRSGWLDNVDTGTGVRALGWAIHPAGNVGRERRVIVVSGDRVVGRAVLGIDRPDISATFPSFDVGRAGWSTEIEGWAPGGSHPPLRAYMIVTEGVLMELHGIAR